MFPFKNNPLNLGPSYKMDSTFLGCFGGDKHSAYQKQNLQFKRFNSDFLVI